MFRAQVRILRHLKLVVAIAVAAMLAWSVAPALSLTPYRPEAVDFEQRVPAVERVAGGAAGARTAGSEHHGHGEGPVRFRSPVIDAPARFDAVGIGDEMRMLEYRARADGGDWTDWVETDSGDPVYFGGADQLQVRSRGVRPRGQLHYVNVSGTQTALSRVLTGARTAVNSALISVASVAAAEAVPSQPEMVGRRSWGANRNKGGCKPRASAAGGKVEAATVHHTVTANDYTREEAPGIVLAICRFHRNGNGWNDIGYNFLVDRFGTTYLGRGGGKRKAVVGAHAQGYNSQTTGAAAIGTHTAKPISKRAREAFVDLIAWKLALHGTKAKGKTRLVSGGGSVNKFRRGKQVRVRRVFGHRRVNSTQCPGGKLKRQLKQIQRRAQRRIDESPESPETDQPQPG